MNAQPCTPPKIKPRNRPEAKAFRKQLRAFRQTIGNNIERTRKAGNVPLRTLARKTGYSAVKLDYWEMGRMNISLEAILRIAKALKVPHQALLATPKSEGVAPETASEGVTGKDRAEPETLEDDAPDETDDSLLMRLLDDPEVQQVREILVRERQDGSYPEEDSVKAMAEPVSDVFDLSLLFSDLVNADVSFYRHGLAWLAASLRRDTERLYRLYHGRQPSYD